MKKKLWLLSIVGLVIFSACGGSSEKAKELQQKILKLVGIPQSIVVNICQDDNNNGFCESIELQAKVTFSQGDTMQTILSKITQTAEGRYLLETYDPTKPLLLELKDENSQYFTSNFILPFNGFEEREEELDVLEEKELSILQAMIDKGVLTTQNVSAARAMQNVDDFYRILLRDLEHNLQILTDKGLTTQQAVSASLIEMADELLINGIENTIPAKMNACNNDQVCVDAILDPLSIELVLTDDEANVIVANIEQTEENEPGVNDSGIVDSNQDKIDLADYLPVSSSTKSYITKYNSLTSSNEETVDSYSESITRNNNTLEYIHNDDSNYSTIVTINENNISSYSDGYEYKNTTNRYANIGDPTWTYSYSAEGDGYATQTDETCIFEARLTEFTHGGYSYNGDILKEKCTMVTTSDINGEERIETDISYGYFQKEIGIIADIDDDCVNQETFVTEDTEGCSPNSYYYDYLVE
ncbi:MAG: Unknown protein [uncultured Sulfurovum sp.]|uniref:Chitinase n=1 Tax=uncultured Sulfurovum sp. TaxID=269237 RepID=A0A6S6SHJ3_9BACT|nr:MAG: Unknown protein [uncultured Sulfurovum sp.]